MLYMIIQAARSLLAAFFHVFKSHISKLKPIWSNPDRLFCFIRTPYFRILLFLLNPDLVSVTFCRICNRSKGAIEIIPLY